MVKEGDIMNLSLLEKIANVFSYIFSSFLSIEMFIISLLLFCVLYINLKKDNKIVQIISVSVYLGFVIGVFITYTSYFVNGIHC